MFGRYADFSAIPGFANIAQRRDHHAGNNRAQIKQRMNFP
jgi:hypothetical protein